MKNSTKLGEKPKSKLTKEQIIRENWHRGRLEWKFHAGQLVINDAYQKVHGNLFVCNIARQFGKSYWAVGYAISFALRNPKSQIRYGAAFHTDLAEFILPAFDKILEDCPQSIKPIYKRARSEYIFKNDSRIKLVGVDRKPNGLRGNTLDLIILDEVGFISNLEYLYKSVIIPSTTHRPNAKVIMVSTPPSTPAHAFTTFCQKAQGEGSYVELDIYKNPLINEATIARLMEESGGESSTTWKREYLCQMVTDSDLAIIPEWSDELIQDIERDEYFKYYHKYVGLDLGVKDLSAGIFGHYDFKRAALIIEDEFDTAKEGSSLNTERLVRLIREKEKQLWGEGPEGKPFEPFRRIADNNWPLVINDFSYLHSLTFIATDKDLLEAMINELRILIQNKRILIHPRCKKLIGCLKFGVWDEKKKGFARSTLYGHFDHLAALIYLTRNIAQHTNPIPATHGFEGHRSWKHNLDTSGRSPNVQTFKKLLTRPKKPTLKRIK